jgi:hypothetical protein
VGLKGVGGKEVHWMVRRSDFAISAERRIAPNLDIVEQHSIHVDEAVSANLTSAMHFAPWAEVNWMIQSLRTLNRRALCDFRIFLHQFLPALSVIHDHMNSTQFGLIFNCRIPDHEASQWGLRLRLQRVHRSGRGRADCGPPYT